MSMKILTISVLLFFVSCWSSADTRSQRVLPCCYEASSYVKGVITECIKQEPRRGCNSSNYVVRVQSGKWYCIYSDSRWMTKQIETGKVICHH